jgi:hypothetical protein
MDDTTVLLVLLGRSNLAGRPFGVAKKNTELRLRRWVFETLLWRAFLKHGEGQCMTTCTTWRAGLHDTSKHSAMHIAKYSVLHDNMRFMMSYASYSSALHDNLRFMTPWTSWLPPVTFQLTPTDILGRLDSVCLYVGTVDWPIAPSSSESWTSRHFLDHLQVAAERENSNLGKKLPCKKF